MIGDVGTPPQKPSGVSTPETRRVLRWILDGNRAQDLIYGARARRQIVPLQQCDLILSFAGDDDRRKGDLHVAAVGSAYSRPCLS